MGIVCTILSYYHLIYVKHVMRFLYYRYMQGEVRRHGVSCFILGYICFCSVNAVLNIFYTFMMPIVYIIIKSSSSSSIFKYTYYKALFVASKLFFED